MTNPGSRLVMTLQDNLTAMLVIPRISLFGYI